jgi:hypothetical protein
MLVGLLISITRNKNKQKIKHAILFFSQKKLSQSRVWFKKIIPTGYVAYYQKNYLKRDKKKKM